MVLGPGHPTWRALHEKLATLAGVSDSAFAFVLDEGNGLWCVAVPGEASHGSTPTQDKAAERFYAAEIVPRMSSMRRGVAFVVVKTGGEDRYVAVSFAAIYVVVLWFEKDLSERDVSNIRVHLRHALPEIERLTLLLPPSGGPGTDRGAMKMRA